MIDHGELVKWVTESEDATTDARELSEKCRDYYDSKQWTAPEKAKLKRQKQAATVSNRIKPKADSMLGMESNNRTTAKAFPRTPKEEEGANAATEGIRYVLEQQEFNAKRSASFDNIVVEGTGGFEITVKPKGDEYDVIINQIPWDRIIIDPHARRKNATDRRYGGQVVWMDYDQAAAKYPDGKDVLQDMQSNSTTYDDKPRWMDDSRRRVKIVELYYPQDNDWWYCCFTRGGPLEGPKISPFKTDTGETEDPYEFGSAFVDREGNRYSPLAQLLDMQDEINKRRSKALHLMSVRQVRWERGAVEDINKARQELAKPDGVIETTPGMEFEILKTGDMAAAQFNLLTEAKAEIDSVGANAATQGKDVHAVSGRALMAREAAGKTELAPVFDVLKSLDLRVYKKVWNRIRQYWKSEKWIRVTDDERNLKFVGLNKPVTKGEQILEQAKAQGAPPEILQQIAQKIAQDPAMKEVVDTKNDIVSMDIDIAMQEVPDVLTSQIEDFQTLGEMVKSGFQMPPLAVIEASPLNNKEKILKMMKESPQIPPQVQEQMKKMQEAVQTTQEQAKKLQEENQQLKAGAEVKRMEITANARAEQERLNAETQARERELAIENRFKIQEAMMADRFDRWEAILQGKVRVEVAEVAAGATVEASQISAAQSAVQ